MNCKRARSALEARLAERLNGRSRAQLEEHLGRCAACRRLGQQLEGLEGQLRQAWPETELPVPLKNRVLASARAAQGVAARPRRRLLQLAGWATAAAALLLVAHLVRMPPVVEPAQSVRLALPEGTALVRAPEFSVLEAGER